MCPFSGTVQFLIVIVTLLLLCHAAIVRAATITFKPENVTMHMYDTLKVEYTIYDETVPPDNTGDGNMYLIYSESPHVATLDREVVLVTEPSHTDYFNLSGKFIGQTVIRCNKTSGKVVDGKINVVVIREERVIDKVFTASVATLVALIYINFGCAVNWGELKNILKRPIGPAIGFCGQFLIMPVLSYVIGYVLFPDNPEMRLGMFFAGVSPAGGASNIWTAVLEGNIDLSVLMTTVSTIAAFAMMPLWIFTLGKTIFDKGNLSVPYGQISTYVVALVVPLGIGYLITRYLKRFGQFMARILKGFSSLLILFIIIFAIVTNLYLFELFSWRIVVAGMGLPYLGYLLGYVMALVLRQPAPDRLAIAIETGIQNTGISIFLLRFALPQPQADLTTVAPVSVAIMTPFPLMIMFIYKKLRQRFLTQKKLDLPDSELVSKLAPENNNLNGNPKLSIIS